MAITADEINAILSEWRTRNTETYIGMRYVPVFEGVWDGTLEYEPLTIVQSDGSAYVSKAYVPVGVQLSDSTFWMPWGDFADGVVTLETLSSEVASAYVRTFDTVAQMQAATDLAAGMTCHTSGFHASGDGGAAYYTVGASGTANGMDVLALQGGLYATLVVTEPYVTPEMFGAWGDGTNDDTDSIEASANSGAFVSFDSGKTYVVSTEIELSTPVIIDGNGATLACNSSTTRINVFNIKVSNVIIKNLNALSTNDQTLVNDGNQYTGEVSSNLTFAYVQGSDCTFENLTLDKFFSGIYVQGTLNDDVENTYIDNCRITGAGMGVAVWCGKNTVLMNSYVEMQETALQILHGLYLMKSDGFKAINCTFKNLSGAYDLISLHPSSLSPDTYYINDTILDGCELLSYGSIAIDAKYASVLLVRDCKVYCPDGIAFVGEYLVDSIEFDGCSIEFTTTTYNGFFTAASTATLESITARNCTIIGSTTHYWLRGATTFIFDRCSFYLTSQNIVFCNASASNNLIGSYCITNCYFEGTFGVVTLADNITNDLIVTLVNNIFRRTTTALNYFVYCSSGAGTAVLNMANNTGYGFNNLQQTNVAAINIGNTISSTTF